MNSASDEPRCPASLIAAVVATAALAGFFVVMALLALAGGNGAFSGHIALGLAVWSILNAAAAVVLARRAWWARGPVVALGLLHVLAFGQSMTATVWALLGLVTALIAVVGAVLPTTRDALGSPSGSACGDGDAAVESARGAD